MGCVPLSWSHRCSDRRDFWHTCSLPSWEGYRLSNAPQARHAAKPRHAAPQARKKKKKKRAGAPLGAPHAASPRHAAPQARKKKKKKKKKNALSKTRRRRRVTRRRRRVK